jgi:acyl-CoA hydrolase
MQPSHMITLPYPMLTAEEAAELVRAAETLAFGGFTAAGI